jgi:hypothetical protein
MLAFLLAAAVTVSCPTVQPGPTWVCVDGGWRPANQVPPAPAPEPAPAPPTTGQQAPLTLRFQVGHTYTRPTTGVVLHMVAVGAVRNGLAVYAAECVNVVTAEQCFFPGEGRFILANAEALGWVEVP